MAGAVSLCRRDGSRLDLRSNTEGTLIPSLEDVLSVDMDAVKWVLVIEKEVDRQSLEYWWESNFELGYVPVNHHICRMAIITLAGRCYDCAQPTAYALTFYRRLTLHRERATQILQPGQWHASSREPRRITALSLHKFMVSWTMTRTVWQYYQPTSMGR